jgi:hypothetical protein
LKMVKNSGGSRTCVPHNSVLTLYHCAILTYINDAKFLIYKKAKSHRSA